MSDIVFLWFHPTFFAVLGKVRSAVGSAKLLMSQKFQQFRKLCEENLVSFCLFDLFCSLPFFRPVAAIYL